LLRASLQSVHIADKGCETAIGLELQHPSAWDLVFSEGGRQEREAKEEIVE
jgi:hypothetical protein